jgi:threonine/homoserine/homoserine lactone efflux protein
MITFTLFSALSTFYFTMFFTPGPNNAMLTASGMKFGFVRTLPHLIGIPLGHILQIGLTCFGLANLFLLYPQIQFYMKVLCFTYMLYLSWKMIGSFNMMKKETGRPLKFYEASLFQFINPKAWSIAVTVAAGFLPVEENIFIGVSFVTITAAVICFPTICLWALFGSGLKKFVTNIKIKKLVECLLSILLILTGIYILLGR